MPIAKIRRAGKIRVVLTTKSVEQANGEVRERVELHVPEGDEANQDFLRYLERKLPGMPKLSRKKTP
jgi:hypothetical protein